MLGTCWSHGHVLNPVTNLIHIFFLCCNGQQPGLNATALPSWRRANFGAPLVLATVAWHQTGWDNIYWGNTIIMMVLEGKKEENSRNIVAFTGFFTGFLIDWSGSQLSKWTMSNICTIKYVWNSFSWNIFSLHGNYVETDLNPMRKYVEALARSGQRCQQEAL